MPGRARLPCLLCSGLVGLRFAAGRFVKAWVLALCVASAAITVQAQGVDASVLALRREDGNLTLEYTLRTQLPRPVQDALRRGIPMYFTAQATLLRARWYWRDERVARVVRNWRLAYQPLTDSWRVGIGALNQSFATLDEALGVILRTSGWRLVELAQLDAELRYTVEFSFRLDTTQLPPPMLVGLTGNGDWQLGIQRSLDVE